MKNDIQARASWGPAYDAIPKSVFALIAWHLANMASGSADESGAAEATFIEEAESLHLNGLLSDSHLKMIKKAVQL